MQVHVLAGANTRPPSCLQQWCELQPTENYIMGSSQVHMCLCNLNAHPIEIPARTVIGQVMPANQVPLVALLTGS